VRREVALHVPSPAAKGRLRMTLRGPGCRVLLNPGAVKARRRQVSRYPRGMHGYGATPPAADWPGGARIAVSLVLNYEEGGENNVLHGDAASEAFLSEIVGAAPWPGLRHWNMEPICDYGARARFWRVHRLLTGV